MDDTAAGSLQNLHDIVAPAPVPWWPVAPGWYVLLAVLAFGAGLLAYRWLRRYRRDRYRRAALQGLMQIRAGQSPGQAAAEVATLLKQTALAAWPRKRVASLSGQAWADFLARTGADEADADLLSRLAYQAAALGEADMQGVYAAAEAWIRHHRTGAA
jgi:hypothetical protein